MAELVVRQRGPEKLTGGGDEPDELGVEPEPQKIEVE